MVPTKYLLTFLFLAFKCVEPFQVLVYVPKAVERGKAATLICISDLYTENIYKVTWKKDDSKIYRYKPSDVGSEREIFRSPGLRIDERLSNLTHLYVPEVDIGTEGTFTCEVESRGPSFFTRRNSSELRVFHIPQDLIKIVENQPGHRNLRSMDLACVSSPSYPETELQWLINGRPADSDYISGYDVSKQSDQTKVSKLGLKYRAKKADLGRGHLNFTCQGVIQLKYSSSTQVLGQFSNSLTIRPRESDSNGAFTHETMDYSDDNSHHNLHHEPHKGDKKKKKNSAIRETMNWTLIVFHFVLYASLQ